MAWPREIWHYPTSFSFYMRGKGGGRREIRNNFLDSDLSPWVDVMLLIKMWKTAWEKNLERGTSGFQLWPC